MRVAADLFASPPLVAVRSNGADVDTDRRSSEASSMLLVRTGGGADATEVAAELADAKELGIGDDSRVGDSTVTGSGCGGGGGQDRPSRVRGRVMGSLPMSAIAASKAPRVLRSGPVLGAVHVRASGAIERARGAAAGGTAFGTDQKTGDGEADEDNRASEPGS